jgi:hypothetical protein
MMVFIQLQVPTIFQFEAGFQFDDKEMIWSSKATPQAKTFAWLVLSREVSNCICIGQEKDPSQSNLPFVQHGT